LARGKVETTQDHEETSNFIGDVNETPSKSEFQDQEPMNNDDLMRGHFNAGHLSPSQLLSSLNNQ